MKVKSFLLGLTLVSLPVMLLPVNVTAHDIEVDGIYYNIIGPSELAVTSRDYDSEGLTYYGKLEIPSNVEYEGINYTVTTIDPDAFFKAKNIWSVTIPSTITDLYWDAFMESFVTSIIAPDLETWCGITFHIDCSFSQGEPEFAVDTHNLVTEQDIENLIIPQSVTDIHDYCFYNTYNINSVVIPDQVTRIGKGAFAVCPNLESVKIGSHVTFIGSQAFDLCSVRYWAIFWSDENQNIIDEITCMATIPPVVESKYSFSMGSYKHSVLRVPAGSVEAYRAAENWSRFENIEAIPGAGPGDVNGDGYYGINDATELIDVLMGRVMESPYADVNGDGVITINDVTDLIDNLLFQQP